MYIEGTPAWKKYINMKTYRLHKKTDMISSNSLLWPNVFLTTIGNNLIPTLGCPTQYRDFGARPPRVLHFVVSIRVNFKNQISTSCHIMICITYTVTLVITIVYFMVVHRFVENIFAVLLISISLKCQILSSGGLVLRMRYVRG